MDGPNEEFSITLKDEDKQKIETELGNIVSSAFESMNHIFKGAEEQLQEIYKMVPKDMRFKDFVRYLSLYEKSEKNLSRQQLAQYISYGYLPNGIKAPNDNQAIYTYEHFFRCLLILKLKKIYSFEIIKIILDNIPVVEGELSGETVASIYFAYSFFEKSWFEAFEKHFESIKEDGSNLFSIFLSGLISGSASIKVFQKLITDVNDDKKTKVDKLKDDKE